MINKIVLLIFVSIFSLNMFAQNEYILPSGLNVSNQLKYSYDNDKKIEIFENWLNLNYRYGVFSSGIRFESFQPNDPNPSINRNNKISSDIAFKYISVELGDKDEGLSFTAGNFYEMFGRGMILKSYENRDLRVDNNLSGLIVKGNYANFEITALSGSAENLDQKREDILHAVDVEYSFENIGKVGASYAVNIPKNATLSRTELMSIRVQPSVWNFDLYSEFGVKKNNDIKSSVFNNNEQIVGKGFYTNLNFYYDNFSIATEYKYYDNYTFSSSDNSIIYNTPPSVRKDYTYILLNRHPSSLDQNNETGFQFDATYIIDDRFELNANYSQTKSLTNKSYFQRANGLNLEQSKTFEEAYGQLFAKWNDKINNTFAFNYNYEATSNTKNYSPIIETKYYLDDINSFKIVFEHQFTKNQVTFEEYYSDLLLIEYLKSPKYSISGVVEMQTKEPKADYTIRKIWGFIQFGYTIGDHTTVSLLAGSRQAGNICIGGVCRYEPEFRGVELRMVTNLY